MGRRFNILKKTIVIRVCILVALLVLSICLTISLLYIAFPRDSVTPPAIVTNSPTFREVATPEPVYSPPARLDIAKLAVAAPVAPVGLTQDNAMDIPQDIEKTVWYKLGPKPGEKGSAVIAGHYGWTNGQGAVFNGLHTLQPGDKITVHDEKGLALNFIVRETRKYDFNAKATEVFHSTDEKSHLNLITCGGSWDDSRQTYSDRIVVFSDLET